MISTTIVDRLDMKNWREVVELAASWEAPGAAPAARLSAGLGESKFPFPADERKVGPCRATVTGLKVKILLVEPITSARQRT